MVRIVGILCGSALAISLLIIALGVPEFLPSPEDIPATVGEPVATSESSEIPAVITEIDEIESDPTPEPATIVEASVETNIKTNIETSIEASREKTNELTAEVIPETTFAAETPPPPSTEHWYAFWSPFGSELAANGFVSQLQRTTGMDYRVVQLKPGVYEVAFAYAEDADIASNLATISSATGLEMPDG
jgi:hypothetical protein